MDRIDVIVLVVFAGTAAGVLLSPRRTAQAAVALVPLAFMSFYINPLLYVLVAPAAAAVIVWPVLWYVLFSLPGELVDRYATYAFHASIQPPPERPPATPLDALSIQRP